MAAVDRDIPYGRRPAQRLDVHRPPQARGAPVLVLVHGGAWAMGDKANPDFIEAKAAHFTGCGWVVVSVNYRLLPWGRPPEQADDVAQAVAAVRREIGRWGGDGQRVCLLGHSTGAHLVALALARGDIAGVAGAVLLDSAALDVVRVMVGAHLPLHDRAFGNDRAAWEDASPWHRLRGRLPPLLLVASAHRPEAVEQAERFAEKARGFGGRAEVESLELGHAEINRHLGLPGAYTQRVDTFLEGCAGKPRGGAIPADS